jgi:Xaa-Pro dipeptidase
MNTRVQHVLELMKQLDLAAIALNPSPSLSYLTSLSFHLMERPTVYILTQAGTEAIVLPELERGKLDAVQGRLLDFTYGDDPATWPFAFAQAAQKLDIGAGKIGVEPTLMRVLELRYLERALPDAAFVDGSEVFSRLRINKDVDEIAKMKKAAEIAQHALLMTLKSLREGMTEKQIVNALIIQLLNTGSDPHLPFSPIVAIGENSANPHAVPTDRALRPGDLLLTDWGASYQGYFSDITRTFTFGEVDPELVKIGEIVLAANQAARDAGKPGIEAGAIDRAARDVITDAGYGSFFIHRTGHGLGMEAHEAPYIFAASELVLTPGATFTIEPGIYLLGKGGVRIEDDVVITDDGLLSLTDLPRQVSPVEALID